MKVHQPPCCIVKNENELAQCINRRHWNMAGYHNYLQRRTHICSIDVDNIMATDGLAAHATRTPITILCRVRSWNNSMPCTSRYVLIQLILLGYFIFGTRMASKCIRRYGCAPCCQFNKESKMVKWSQMLHVSLPICVFTCFRWKLCIMKHYKMWRAYKFLSHRVGSFWNIVNILILSMLYN